MHNKALESDLRAEGILVQTQMPTNEMLGLEDIGVDLDLKHHVEDLLKIKDSRKETILNMFEAADAKNNSPVIKKLQTDLLANFEFSQVINNSPEKLLPIPENNKECDSEKNSSQSEETEDSVETQKRKKRNKKKCDKKKNMPIKGDKPKTIEAINLPDWLDENLLSKNNEKKEENTDILLNFTEKPKLGLQFENLFKKLFTDSLKQKFENFDKESEKIRATEFEDSKIDQNIDPIALEPQILIEEQKNENIILPENNTLSSKPSLQPQLLATSQYGIFIWDFNK